MLTGNDVTDLIDGMDSNGLLQGFSHMLTGYIGSATFLKAISGIVDRITAYNPDLKYVCDPVLGDDGQFYVPEELVDLFREHLLPKAYMITPNQFEAEKLTQSKIENETNLLSAIENLHSLGPKIVIITSTHFTKNNNQIILYGS